MREANERRRVNEPLVLVAVALLILVFSGTGPADRLTWVLEALPVVIGVPILVATFPRWPLTPLLYRLLFVHAVILMVGAHYTYAEVPVGFWVRDWLDLSRNPYDRLGHLAQGFIPAILAREILSRWSPLAGSRWLPVLVVSVCLAFSAFYELTEWWAALAVGEAADSFLGTQGDVWDTQWDMALALTGAVLSLALLSRLHDRQLRQFR